MNLWNKWKSNQIDFIQTASHYSNMDLLQLQDVTLSKMYNGFSCFISTELLQVAPFTSFLKVIKNPKDSKSFWNWYEERAADKRRSLTRHAIRKGSRKNPTRQANDKVGTKNPTRQANPGAKRKPKRQRVQ
ncbi:hypothetical protein CROQUDRAFT_666558 [Cronartium quercuum f. sp. fusiforme G11]|uniref:Uncharacterized protein n=1 Tax=Cronartium quercuum f. sp. fusiforme G11 TaxID=708437 RepID=A0A9P6N617_9BASI|nr:hypothetical protein CROQUDRAFT_666558 [Cronartium quercuum f. sp. fusiforme G11]